MDSAATDTNRPEESSLNAFSPGMPLSAFNGLMFVAAVLAATFVQGFFAGLAVSMTLAAGISAGLATRFVMQMRAVERESPFMKLRNQINGLRPAPAFFALVAQGVIAGLSWSVIIVGGAALFRAVQ